ncbi:MAG: hypothetical protein D6791_04300 [Chloroflexi bacterium]|nr:MAG: hypothetical protein D6791_04300 [Chloroflexota bacterium]
MFQGAFERRVAMKKLLSHLFVSGMAFVLLGTACNLQISVPTEVSSPPPVTEALPSPSSPVTEAVPSPSVTAPEEAPATSSPLVDTLTLPMEVGSTYLYVDGSILIAVPAGEFLMGRGGADNPLHTVFLDDFWIYRTPVTNQQYAACVAAGQCAPPNLEDNTAYDDPYRANDPVVGVTWEQAAAYCTFVHGRLPTEAEWEKTARGPDGNIYPWGEAAPSCDLANLANCVGTTSDVATHPLGKSYYGALDMAGNTFEWVADWYSPTYYNESPSENPFGPEIGEKRSVRSSGFAADFYLAESARRFFEKPDVHRADLGFRCVVEDPTYFAPYCEYVTIFGGMPGAVWSEISVSFVETCPDLSISQRQYCGAGDVPLTNVTFTGPVGATIDPDGCTPAGGNTYVCNAPTTVKICAECSLGGTLDASCPPGYHPSPPSLYCLPDRGLRGECLPGWTYDPATQCCRAEPGTGGTIPVFPLCPAGMYFANPPGGCVPFPAVGTACETLDVTFKACGSHGGNDGGCTLTANDCRKRNLDFDPNRCCCVPFSGGGCVQP